MAPSPAPRSARRRPRAPTTTAGVHPSQIRVTQTTLGRGSFGTVLLGTFCGCEVAVKRCALTEPHSPAVIQFRRELSRYQRLRHPCITQFFGLVSHRSSNQLLLVTELMRGGSLFHALGDLREAGVHHLAHESLLRIAQHIAHGLSYLHASQFSFGDLKSMNVLLSEKPCISSASFRAGAHAKLCDFGLSRNLRQVSHPERTHDALHETHVPGANAAAGTYAYLAPEAFNGLPVDDAFAPKAADIYALGIVLWELATLQKPWAGRQPLQLIHVVAKLRQRPPWPHDVCVPHGYVQLVERCWHHDAQSRPHVEQVCAELLRMYEQLSSDDDDTLPSSPASEREAECVQCVTPRVGDLDDLTEFGAIHVDEHLNEDVHGAHVWPRQQAHLEEHRLDASLATIKQVQSMRLSAEEVHSICDNMSELASEVTHASAHSSAYKLRNEHDNKHMSVEYNSYQQAHFEASESALTSMASDTNELACDDGRCFGQRTAHSLCDNSSNSNSNSNNNTSDNSVSLQRVQYGSSDSGLKRISGSANELADKLRSSSSSNNNNDNNNNNNNKLSADVNSFHAAQHGTSATSHAMRVSSSEANQMELGEGGGQYRLPCSVVNEQEIEQELHALELEESDSVEQYGISLERRSFRYW